MLFQNLMLLGFGVDGGNIIASAFTARTVQAYRTWSTTVIGAPFVTVLSCAEILTRKADFDVLVTGSWSYLQVVDGWDLIASTFRARAFKTCGTWTRAGIGTPGGTVLGLTQISARISEFSVLLEV